MDLDIVVGMDDYAIDQEPDELLARCEVGALEGLFNALHQCRYMGLEGLAHVLVTNSRVCLCQSFCGYLPPAFDLFTPCLQVVGINHAFLIRIDNPLHLLIAVSFPQRVGTYPFES